MLEAEPPLFTKWSPVAQVIWSVPSSSPFIGILGCAALLNQRSHSWGGPQAEGQARLEFSLTWWTAHSRRGSPGPKAAVSFPSPTTSDHLNGAPEGSSVGQCSWKLPSHRPSVSLLPGMGPVLYIQPWGPIPLFLGLHLTFLLALKSFSWTKAAYLKFTPAF